MTRTTQHHGPRPKHFLLALFGLTLVPLVFAQSNDKPDPDPDRFADAIKRFESWDAKNAWPSDAVLFAGSSSIRMWKTREAFPDLPVINRGFGGAHISDVQHFAERVVLPYRPAVIVFYAGDNDIAAGKPPEQVAGDFRAFTSWLHQELPKTRMIFIAIKPSVNRWKHWPEMKQANGLIRAFIATDDLLSYADIAAPVLKDDGQSPAEELFLKDGLHLSDKGYEIWKKVIRPLIDAACEAIKK